MMTFQQNDLQLVQTNYQDIIHVNDVEERLKVSKITAAAVLQDIVTQTVPALSDPNLIDNKLFQKETGLPLATLFMMLKDECKLVVRNDNIAAVERHLRMEFFGECHERTEYDADTKRNVLDNIIEKIDSARFNERYNVTSIGGYLQTFRHYF